MVRSTKILTSIVIAVALCAVFSHSVFGAAAKLQKSVTPMEGGEYLIKLKVTATGSSIYALNLIDAQSSIIDVYAPLGWCMVTDGEDLIARTYDEPIKAGKSVEFVIHSTSKDIGFTWSVAGRLEQIGEAGTI